MPLSPSSKAPEQGWLRPPRHPALAAGDVHVWRISLECSPSQYARLRGLLSTDELERADRFIVQSARDAFVAARAQARCLLAAYVGEDPAALRFFYGRHGKPFLQASVGGDVLQFNLSHSGAIALLAVGRSNPVGIDLERVREGVDNDAVVEDVFCAAERLHLDSLRGSERRYAFFRYWTSKESVLKGLGTGLSLPARMCAVDLGRGTAVVSSAPAIPPEQRIWRLFPVSAGSGYTGTLACLDEPGAIRFWQHTVPE